MFCSRECGHTWEKNSPITYVTVVCAGEDLGENAKGFE